MSCHFTAVEYFICRPFSETEFVNVNLSVHGLLVNTVQLNDQRCSLATHLICSRPYMSHRHDSLARGTGPLAKSHITNGHSVPCGCVTRARTMTEGVLRHEYFKAILIHGQQSVFEEAPLNQMPRLGVYHYENSRLERSYLIILVSYNMRMKAKEGILLGIITLVSIGFASSK